MKAGTLVVAYHGCDISVRDGLVRGRLKFKPSGGKYDWLGDGAYFFEDDEQRAMRFAQASKDFPDRLYTRQPIVMPSVVGALICATWWVDMTTQRGIAEYKRAHDVLALAQRQKGEPMPENKVADDADKTILHRHLDCAVFNLMPEVRAMPVPPEPEIQAIRAAFYQGGSVAHTSEFRDETHVQISLKDLNCIVGWFLPSGAELLSDVDLAAAQAAMREAIKARTARKPRKRAMR